MIGFVYVEPGKVKQADLMKSIRQGMERCDPANPLIIMGDMNARVGDGRACNTENSFRYIECVPEEEQVTLLERSLIDKGRTIYGMELRQLADMDNLSILNGTFLDSSRGSLTCFAQPCHPTNIDLGLVSSEDVNLVDKLSTLDYYPDLSDHCPIFLRTTITRCPEGDDYLAGEEGVAVELTKAQWTPESREEVACSMSLDCTRERCSEILNKMSNQQGTRAIFPCNGQLSQNILLPEERA